ncbi:hypothetical protein BH10PSE19_BH10PSE19_02790 [soil metagenome]
MYTPSRARAKQPPASSSSLSSGPPTGVLSETKKRLIAEKRKQAILDKNSAPLRFTSMLGSESIHPSERSMETASTSSSTSASREGNLGVLARREVATVEGAITISSETKISPLAVQSGGRSMLHSTPEPLTPHRGSILGMFRSTNRAQKPRTMVSVFAPTHSLPPSFPLEAPPSPSPSHSDSERVIHVLPRPEKDWLTKIAEKPPGLTIDIGDREVSAEPDTDDFIWATPIPLSTPDAKTAKVVVPLRSPSMSSSDLKDLPMQAQEMSRGKMQWPQPPDTARKPMTGTPQKIPLLDLLAVVDQPTSSPSIGDAAQRTLRFRAPLAIGRSIVSIGYGEVNLAGFPPIGVIAQQCPEFSRLAGTAYLNTDEKKKNRGITSKQKQVMSTLENLHDQETHEAPPRKARVAKISGHSSATPTETSFPVINRGSRSQRAGIELSEEPIPLSRPIFGRRADSHSSSKGLERKRSAFEREVVLPEYSPGGKAIDASPSMSISRARPATPLRHRTPSRLARFSSSGSESSGVTNVNIIGDTDGRIKEIAPSSGSGAARLPVLHHATMFSPRNPVLLRPHKVTSSILGAAMETPGKIFAELPAVDVSLSKGDSSTPRGRSPSPSRLPHSSP